MASDIKFNWKQWDRSSKFILAAGCVALFSIFPKWKAIGSDIRHGFTLPGLYVALLLFVYPVLTVLRERELSFKYGMWCGIGGVIWGLLAIAGMNVSPGSVFFLIASCLLIAGVFGRSSPSPAKDKILATWEPMETKQRLIWVGGGIGGFVGIVLLFSALGENNALEARQIQMVKNIVLPANPKYPIGEVLDSVCSITRWSSIKTKMGVPLVQFTGSTKRGEVLFQFEIRQSGPLQVYSELDGKKMSAVEVAGFYMAAFKEYESKN